MHGVGSRNKLRASHARFYPGSGLLDALARAVCVAGCLPRKELHEAFEMATLVRQHFRHGRVVDLCAGYGLLAQCMLLLDDQQDDAIALDVKPSPNHRRVHDAIVAAFPSLSGRVQFITMPLQRFVFEPTDIVVSSHACGSLTDDVLSAASSAGTRVAVLPCCHGHRWRPDLDNHVDPAAAMDHERVDRLTLTHHAWTDAISAAVTPKNRVIIGTPRMELRFDSA
jgi:hypothetical protein